MFYNSTNMKSYETYFVERRKLPFFERSTFSKSTIKKMNPLFIAEKELTLGEMKVLKILIDSFHQSTLLVI